MPKRAKKIANEIMTDHGRGMSHKQTEDQRTG